MQNIVLIVIVLEMIILFVFSFLFFSFSYFLYLNGHPKFHITKLLRSPLLTGHTLCHTNEGNTTKDPLGNISLHF